MKPSPAPGLRARSVAIALVLVLAGTSLGEPAPAVDVAPAANVPQAPLPTPAPPSASAPAPTAAPLQTPSLEASASSAVVAPAPRGAATVKTTYAVEPLAAMKGTIAVNDFAAKGVSQDEADLLTDEIRMSLLQSKAPVLEKSAMTQRLRSRPGADGFQCDDADCIVEVGRLLGVPQVVLGTVGKVGKLYIVTARIVDVSTGQVQAAFTERAEGAIEQVLTTIPPRIASALARELRTWRAGDLVVETVPAGATLQIDGAVAGTTPFRDTAITLGAHQLRIDLADHRTELPSILLERGKPVRVRLDLEPVPALRREQACRQDLKATRDTAEWFANSLLGCTDNGKRLRKTLDDSLNALSLRTAAARLRRTKGLFLAGGGFGLIATGLVLDAVAEKKHSEAFNYASTGARRTAMRDNALGEGLVLGGALLSGWGVWTLAF